MKKSHQDIVTQMHRLVDAEYANLAAYNQDAFHTYMVDTFPGVTRDMTDEVWDIAIGESMNKDDNRVAIAIEKMLESEESFTTATLGNTEIGRDGIKINALIQDPNLNDEINWTYDPVTDKISSDVPVSNPVGYLLLTLLLNAKAITREDFDKMSEVLG